MTTTDPFTEAARAEAWRRHPDPVDIETGEPVDDWGFEEQGRRDFQAGAEWARAHLAAQEPTDAEVEAAAIMLCASAHHDRVWKALAEVDPRKQERIRADARRALSAARAARRDEAGR